MNELTEPIPDEFPTAKQYYEQFRQSVKGLPFLQRYCAYPFALFLLLIYKWDPNDRNLKFCGLTVREIFEREFKSVCDPVERPSPHLAVAEISSDVRRFLEQKRLQPTLSIFAGLSLLGLAVMRMFATLFLAGNMRDILLKHYAEHHGEFNDPRKFRDMALEARPIILLGLIATPITAVWMLAYQCVRSTAEMIGRKQEPEPTGYMRFVQGVNVKEAHGPIAFYHSPCFYWILLLFFVAGLPTLISYALFGHSAFASSVLVSVPADVYPPQFARGMVSGCASGFPSLGGFPLIGLYIASLSWCLMAIFFALYFTLAMNYMSTEYDIEIHPDVIKRLPIKGWFADIFFFYAYAGSACLKWEEVINVSYSTMHLRDSALPANLANNPIVVFLNRLDTFIDKFSRNLAGDCEYLVIKSKNRHITLNLWELSTDERSQIFYAIKKYAPSVHLDATVQRVLVGSTVLNDPMYTELWFDVLSKNSKEGTSGGTLVEGDEVRGGKYTISRKLHSGGQANVFLALDEQKNTVVLKQFQLTPGESLGAMVDSAGAFESESTILSRLSHPAIVKLHELFMDGTCVYLALEHVPGMSLRQMVKEVGPLEEYRVVELARQMSEILQYLHGIDPAIVHRDFTPDNLILSDDFTLKLVDFSASQRQNEKRQDCAGKHSYTPPDQFRGEACPQSDIYALGATLHFLLTGTDPEPISQSNIRELGKASEELAGIIERATELELEDRYPSATWLKTELVALQAKQTTAEDTNSTRIKIPQKKKRAKRR